eukprot:SAG31_NODE_4132_length_3553_cov_2.749855_2_plen_74_part_00
MFLTSGDVFYADLAERSALNALPGAFMNGSMWCESSQLYCHYHFVTLSLCHSVTLSRNDHTAIAAPSIEAEPS